MLQAVTLEAAMLQAVTLEAVILTVFLQVLINIE